MPAAAGSACRARAARAAMRSSSGLRSYTARIVSLNWRMLPNPDANATSAAGSEVEVSSARAVCARCARESASGPGAELGGEHAGEVARRVPESGGEARHALALDDAVGDEAHGACGEVVAQVPLGGAGHRVGQAPLARAQAGLVGGGGREVEADVRRLGGDGRAAGAAVDAGGVHAGDELPVESRVAGLHGAVALGEHGVGERVGDRRRRTS